MKKGWQQPMLEVLDVKMTMAGPGIATPDDVQPDPDAATHPDEVVDHS